MQHALIVSHGQPSDPVPAEAALSRFAQRVQAAASGITVHSATLAAPGRFEAALVDLPDDAVIYPLFMAKGWFVTSALPKRLGDRPLAILDPLGVDTALPDLAAGALVVEMDRLGWAPEQTQLVLAAHGSGRSRNPSQVARDFAADLEQRLPLAGLHVGFVEETPSITDAASGTGEIALCLPFFACQGGHAQEDVPEALEAAGFQGRTLPVLGELPPIPAHIGQHLLEHFESVT
ncbi:MAG: CbiX/SirB N-terminal domain-containing protein [Ruegeria sp.]|uniref:CbiX/SirB N-terminal domain-containing protein n=1 Tax=Ruegeria sp. TaxID=1879320 RepID=UPI00349EF4BC